MSNQVQWPPSHPDNRQQGSWNNNNNNNSGSNNGERSQEQSQCLARFKACEQLRASPPTSTKAAAASLKETFNKNNKAADVGRSFPLPSSPGATPADPQNPKGSGFFSKNCFGSSDSDSNKEASLALNNPKFPYSLSSSFPVPTASPKSIFLTGATPFAESNKSLSFSQRSLADKDKGKDKSLFHSPATQAHQFPPGLVVSLPEPFREEDEEEEKEEDETEKEQEGQRARGLSACSPRAATPGVYVGVGEAGRTGGSQGKGGYSRMWEDPVGERHAIPLYNRLNFATVPRKTSSSKKTWYLVHNTYASLQNSPGPQQNQQQQQQSQHQLQAQPLHHHHPHHHPHHHHLPHHPHHTLATSTRMEEGVGGSGGGDEFCCHNHAERLMRKMETCASKRQLCDVVLLAGPKRIPAHRLVLSAASDYFAAMFMNNVREATMEEVEIKDVEPEALASLVQYTYTGRLELKEETVECLLSTACLLQLSEVVEACCSFLMKQLHPSNCIGIRQFADAQGCTDLYKVANNYVMEMFVEVMHNAEFLLLPCEEVCQLLASDDLNVPNEETIFEALVKWARHDLPARRKYLPRLLSHIKLPLMAPQYIADHVETNCLFREERECQQLIMEALKYHLLPERRSSFQSPRTKPRKSTVGVLYAVGGMDCTKGATSIEKYELRTNTWTQVANMSGRRLQFGVAVLEDRLYVVGGRDGLKTLNTVECYDPKKKTWTLMPPMSTHRHGLGVGVMEGPMYAVGGHDGWSYLNTVERWDPQARQWSYVAPMSTARSTVGVASLHGKLYAVGGRDGSSCLKSVECFDPHTNKWTHCTPMAKRRGGVGVATCNGFLYAVGGHEAPATNPTCSRYDSAERYDPKTDQWTNISPISSPRDAVGLCPLGDELFAVGGYDGQQYLNHVECYDPTSNEWVKVSSLCTGRAGACVVHVPNS